MDGAAGGVIDRDVIRWAIDFRRRMLVADEDDRAGVRRCSECGRILDGGRTVGCRRCGKSKSQREREGGRRCSVST